MNVRLTTTRLCAVGPKMAPMLLPAMLRDAVAALA